MRALIFLLVISFAVAVAQSEESSEEDYPMLEVCKCTLDVEGTECVQSPSCEDFRTKFNALSATDKELLMKKFPILRNLDVLWNYGNYDPILKIIGSCKKDEEVKECKDLLKLF